MSKTKRKTPRRGFENNPMERHTPRKRCEGCGEWFPADDISQDRDSAGRPIGFFCGSCI